MFKKITNITQVQDDFVKTLIAKRRYVKQRVTFDTTNGLVEVHCLQSKAQFEVHAVIVYQKNPVQSSKHVKGTQFARQFIQAHDDVDVVVFLFNITIQAYKIFANTYLDVQTINRALWMSSFWTHSLQPKRIQECANIPLKVKKTYPVLKHNDPICILHGFYVKSCVYLDNQPYFVQ